MLKKVIPSGCKIKFKIKNNFEIKIIGKAELQLINNRIVDYCNKIELLGKEININKTSLNNNLNNSNARIQVNKFLNHSKDEVFKLTINT